MVPLLPAALLALFAVWCGTYVAGAEAGAVAVGHLALLAATLPGWRGSDPLGLGSTGRWLLPALWASAAASAWLSPVPRAGVVAVALLPAFLALPAALASCWRSALALRRGIAAIAASAAALAAAALLAQWVAGAPRAALPLGHHLLLAVCLATLLPLALVPALAAGSRAARAGWALAAVVTGGALLATGSAAGVAGGLVGLAVLTRRAPGWRRWLPVLGGLVAAAAFAQRAASAAAAGDSSWAARLVYWRGATAGLAERPWLGWGPGGTAWTLGLHLRPVPGVSPPGEVVGDVHSLPLQLAYELGGLGALAALLLAAAWLWRRRAELAGGTAAPPSPLTASPEPPAGATRLAAGSPADAEWVALVRRAGLAGVCGGLTALLVTPTLATTGPWLCLAVAAAAALALPELAPGDRPPSPHAGPPPPHHSGLTSAGAGPPRPDAETAARGAGSLRLAAAAYLVLAAIALARLDLAHLAYDRAAAAPAAPTAAARHHLERAVALDPWHPLYRARLAWLAGAGSGERAAGLQVASDAAPGVGFLALLAGAAAADAGTESATALLERACATDPLSGRPPYLLALRAERRQAAELAARAFLAEPQLAAAVEWERRPGLLATATQQVRAWQGVDRGYRTDLADALRRAPGRGPVRRLLWRVEESRERPDRSPSLVAFRRRPWPHPVPLATVLVRLDGAEALGAFPRATALRTSAAAAFPPSCAP